MKRRFVVMTENLTATEEEQFKSEVGAVHWWHWLPNAWLIVDYSGIASANSISDALHKVAPKAQCLVLAVTPGEWASYERKTPHGVLSDWVRSTFVE